MRRHSSGIICLDVIDGVSLDIVFLNERVLLTQELYNICNIELSIKRISANA